VTLLQALGDELLDSIVSDNIPIYTEQEKYNASVLSSVDRWVLSLQLVEVSVGAILLWAWCILARARVSAFHRSCDLQANS
jgi:hypothetical protein